MRKTPTAVTLSLAISLLLGLLLIIFSALKVGSEFRYVGFILPDLLHDLGIAFLVSASVAGLFEIYRANRHELVSMKEVIDFAMGEKITGDVWQEVQELLEAKEVIRRNVRLRLQFEPVAGLQPHESSLKVEHEYNLYALRDKRSKARLRHELDYQFQSQQFRLPRWEAVVVYPSDAKTKPEKIDLTNPKLDVEISLPRRSDEEGVFVRTERIELAHLPGSYNLYSPEFIKGLHVSVVGCPKDVRIEVWVRPHGGSEQLLDQDHTWVYEPLLFPGQGIEIKFISCSDSASIAPVAMVAC